MDSCDGNIFVSATGNNLPFNYLWNPGGITTEDLKNVCAGDYLLEVENSLGCKIFKEIKLEDPDSMVILAIKKDAICGECNGTIAINNADTSLYRYEWSNGKTTSSIEGLCTGKYSVLVTTKGKDCSKELSFVINTTDGPEIEVPFKKNPTCKDLCNGIIEILPKGGVLPYQVKWLHNNENTNRVEDLCEGKYTVQVIDGKGCSSISEIELIYPNPIIDSVYIIPTSCGKNNGQIHLVLKGGVSPLKVEWEHDGSSSLILTGLPSGLYTASVIDFNGCITNLTYNVPNKDVPKPEFRILDVGCKGTCSGKLFLEGNLDGKKYELLDENGQFISIILDSLINLCSGNYWVSLDSAGCKNSSAFTISEPDTLKVLELITKGCFVLWLLRWGS